MIMQMSNCTGVTENLEFKPRRKNTRVRLMSLSKKRYIPNCGLKVLGWTLGRAYLKQQINKHINKTLWALSTASPRINNLPSSNDNPMHLNFGLGILFPTKRNKCSSKSGAEMSEMVLNIVPYQKAGKLSKTARVLSKQLGVQVGTTHLSTNRWMNNKMWYAHRIRLFGNKKKTKYLYLLHDHLWKRFAKWKKPDPGVHILYDSITWVAHGDRKSTRDRLGLEEVGRSDC